MLGLKANQKMTYDVTLSNNNHPTPDVPFTLRQCEGHSNH